MMGVLPVLRYKQKSALIVPLAVFVTAMSFLLRVGPVVTTTAAESGGYKTIVLDAWRYGRRRGWPLGDAGEGFEFENRRKN